MDYKNILVPIDFSETNLKALRKAKQIQSTCNAQLVLAHIIDYAPPNYVRPLLPDLLASEEIMTERAQEHLDSLIADEKLSNYRCIIEIGDTRSKITPLIEKSDVDLVVMAKHSQSGLDRLAGSNTNTVVQKATCDVLVIHE